MYNFSLGGRQLITTGDQITVRCLARKVSGTVIESVKYRDAYIVRYQSDNSGIAMVTPFPGYPELPPLQPDPSLYCMAASVEHGDNIWLSPVGMPQARTNGIGGSDTRLIVGDPFEFAKRRIDHIMDLRGFIHGDMRIYPNNDLERKLYEKWWR